MAAIGFNPSMAGQEASLTASGSLRVGTSDDRWSKGHRFGGLTTLAAPGRV